MVYMVTDVDELIDATLNIMEDDTIVIIIKGGKEFKFKMVDDGIELIEEKNVEDNSNNG